MRTTTLTILAVTTLLAGTARADVKAKLLKGEILTTSGVAVTGVKPGRAMAIINAPLSVTYKVLSQVQYYKEFVPKMAGSAKLGKNKYSLTPALPWPAKGTWVHFKVRQGVRGKTHIFDWKMVAGNFKKFEGTAWLQPYGKNRSLLTYQMLAVPDVTAPESLLTRGMKTVAFELVDAIRDRAHEVRDGKVVMGQKVARK